MTDESISKSGAHARPKLGEDDETPADPRLKRLPTQTSLQIQEFSALVGDISKEYGSIAGKIDRFEEDERRLRLSKLRKKSRETLAVLAKLIETMR